MVGALEILDDDKLDREWVVRNILGGMAAGFGLRGMSMCTCVSQVTYGIFCYCVVVLDCHPFFTTIIVIVGWAVKTGLASLVSRWVGVGIGGQESIAGEMWLAYSIP